MNMEENICHKPVLIQTTENGVNLTYSEISNEIFY